MEDAFCLISIQSAKTFLKCYGVEEGIFLFVFIYYI